MKKEVTYQEAKEAKELLVKYLTAKVGYYDVDDMNQDIQTEGLVLLALKQEYFLK